MDSKSETKPKIDFIGIGVNKCGTTWVYRQLQVHPEVCVSKDKETNFFSRNYFKGFSWYKNQFSHCNMRSKVGEFSPGYLFESESLTRIKESYPTVKLIIVLRDPIDRLRSSWEFDYKRGAHSYKSFDKYTKIAPSEKLQMGLYGEQLTCVLSLFAVDQIHIILFEDIKSRPDTVVKKLYEFLAIDSSYRSETLDKKSNASTEIAVKFRYLNLFLLRTRRFVLNNQYLKLLILPAKLSGVNWLANQIFRVNRTSNIPGDSIDSKLSNETKDILLKYYQNDVLNLSETIGIDLSKIWDNFKIHS